MAHKHPRGPHEGMAHPLWSRYSCSAPPGCMLKPLQLLSTRQTNTYGIITSAASVHSLPQVIPTMWPLGWYDCAAEPSVIAKNRRRRRHRHDFQAEHGEEEEEEQLCETLRQCAQMREEGACLTRISARVSNRGPGAMT